MARELCHIQAKKVGYTGQIGILSESEAQAFIDNYLYLLNLEYDISEILIEYLQWIEDNKEYLCLNEDEEQTMQKLPSKDLIDPKSFEKYQQQSIPTIDTIKMINK